MTAPRPARVGDVIEHGQDIPANVRTVRDTHGDVHRRRGNDLWAMNEEEGYDDPAPWPAGEVAMYVPLTVVEVDPEPHPAEPVDLLELVRLYGHEGYKSGFAAAERDEEAEDHHDGRARRLYDQIEAEVKRLLAHQLTRDELVQNLQAVRDAVASVDAERRAESGPLVLTLPEAPPEAVALIGVESLRRWTPSTSKVLSEAGKWFSAFGGYRTLARVLDLEGSVTVELAPPREPRTWERFDGFPDDVKCVEVNGIQYRRGSLGYWVSQTGHPDKHTSAELHLMGEVREVLGDA